MSVSPPKTARQGVDSEVTRAPNELRAGVVERASEGYIYPCVREENPGWISVDFVEPSADIPSEPGYVYHATNLENLYGIIEDGKLKTHKPWYGTDQDIWPDGSTEKRSYWSPSAATTHWFVPEGGPGVLLRTPRTDAFKTERTTGDVYTTKVVPVTKIEVLTTEGWIGLGDPSTWGRVENPVPASIAFGSAVAGALIGSALTISKLGGNPPEPTEFEEIPDYEGNILLFPRHGSFTISRMIDAATGKVGYSHTGLDLGWVDPEGTPLHVESYGGQGVRLVRPDTYPRAPIQIPLSAADTAYARGVAEALLKARTPYRSHPGGITCSEFVAMCLPKRWRKNIPPNPTPNDLAQIWLGPEGAPRSPLPRRLKAKLLR